MSNIYDTSNSCQIEFLALVTRCSELFAVLDVSEREETIRKPLIAYCHQSQHGRKHAFEITSLEKSTVPVHQYSHFLEIFVHSGLNTTRANRLVRPSPLTVLLYFDFGGISLLCGFDNDGTPSRGLTSIESNKY